MSLNRPMTIERNPHYLFIPCVLAAGFLLGTFLPSTATAQTCNADGGPATVNIGDGVAMEDAGTVTFVITCNPCGKVNANTWWKNTNGSATAGVDYTAIDGQLITIGTTADDLQTYNLVVTLLDDADFEGDESFTVGLGGQPMGEANPSVGPPCLFLGDTTADGTIQNDDPENQPPNADAGGPYSVPEGGNVALNGAGSADPDDDPLTYAWDLDNNGSFETSGVSPSFSAVGRDGPDTQTVVLRVSDGIETDTDRLAPLLCGDKSRDPADGMHHPEEFLRDGACHLYPAIRPAGAFDRMQ